MKTQFRVLLYQTCMALLSLIVVYGVLYRWFDRSTAYFFHSNLHNSMLYPVSLFIGKVFSAFHWFALGIFCFITGAFIRQKNKTLQHSNGLMLFGGSLVGAFITAFILKICLARYRPDMLFEHDLYGFHYFSIQHDFNSTPSGHATEAFAGFFALIRLSKSTLLAVVYTVFAFTIGLSRLVITAHFPSDILLGAYIGILSVFWVEMILNQISHYLI